MTAPPAQVLVCAGRWLRHQFGRMGWGRTCSHCGAPNPVFDGNEPRATP